MLLLLRSLTIIPAIIQEEARRHEEVLGNPVPVAGFVVVLVLVAELFLLEEDDDDSRLLTLDQGCRRVKEGPDLAAPARPTAVALVPAARVYHQPLFRFPASQ